MDLQLKIYIFREADWLLFLSSGKKKKYPENPACRVEAFCEVWLILSKICLYKIESIPFYYILSSVLSPHHSVLSPAPSFPQAQRSSSETLLKHRR
jgi:hypothetical protein